MMELTWDIELAKGAQMWANQCLFEHDGRRTCKFNWIGQNSFRAFFTIPLQGIQPSGLR